MKIHHKSIGATTNANIKGHNMLAECGNCEEQFSYSSETPNINWECPYCLTTTKIQTKMDAGGDVANLLKSKMAHKYNLKVKWSKRVEWDINVLAISAEVVTMWLPKEEKEDDYIVSVNIKLLQRNVEKVKGTFLAKGIDE